ncbi:MAG: hypothetical protein WKF47_09310 [Geodermatophilaceae bacterium]
MIGTVLLFALLALVLCAPLFAPALLHAVRDRLEDRRDRRAMRRPVIAPVGQYVDDLRRLSRELAALPAGAPFARQHGTQLAYDTVLTRLAAALDVDTALASAPVGWARDLERLRTEDAIYAMGLRIHTVGS